MSLESWFAQGAASLAQKWQNTSTEELVWLGVGFTAQGMFTMRFLVQWIATEKARRSIVPETFWYWSFAGGCMLFIYAVYRMDPVFIFGQGTPLFIYARNIYFIRSGKRKNDRVHHSRFNAPAE